MADKTKIQWHPAFCEAMRLTLREDDSELTYENEHMLSHKPLQVDLLVIRLNEKHTIHNVIGRKFRKYNLFEYKSPGDSLNIDTYYKTLAYGCLYKSMTADHINGIRADEITLTMVRYAKPEKLFEDLCSSGISVTNEFPGIYYLGGATVFTTQIIVTKELPRDDFIWLKALTDDLEQPEARQIVTDMGAMENDSWQKQSADAVVQVSISANAVTYDNLKKEDPLMCDALRELMRPEIEEELKQNTAQVTQQTHEDDNINHIRSLMKKEGWPIDRAMESLEIAQDQRARYAKLILGKKADK